MKSHLVRVRDHSEKPDEAVPASSANVDGMDALLATQRIKADPNPRLDLAKYFRMLWPETGSVSCAANGICKIQILKGS
jgi:hypothetical protein